MAEEKMTPLEEYLQQQIDAIKRALPDDVIVGEGAMIEVSTVSTKEVGGGVKFFALNLGAKVSDKEVHKLKLPLKFMTEADKAGEKAEIAKHEATEKMSRRMVRDIRA